MKHLSKFADEELKITKNLESSVSKYEQIKGVHLRPGPYGTQGQIFFVDEDPDIVVKFTRDKSEARNMLLIKMIQDEQPNKFQSRFTPEEIDKIRNGIIKILGVHTITNMDGFAYVIEQERGRDIPISLARKILSITGPNISRQPREVFPAISKELSDKANIEGMANTFAESLMKGNEVVIDPHKDIDVADLGNVLSIIRNKIDDGFKDFRPSNMVITKNNGKYRIKLIDLGYGSTDMNDINMTHLGRFKSQMKKQADEVLSLPNIIMPGEDSIRKAVSRINRKFPGFFSKIKEIRIAPGGTGYAYVTNKEGDEGIVFVDLPKIKSSVTSKMGNMSQEEIQEAIIHAVSESIAHEGGHIESNLEGGEYPAEEKARSVMHVLDACEKFYAFTKKFDK